MTNKQIVYEFLNSQVHTVLATVNKSGRPEGATVGFGQTKELEIIFGTDKTTRKASNISHNKSVALTFNGPYSTLQYEGEATLIEGPEKEKYAEIYFRKVPDAHKYYNLANQIYYLVVPHWLRYTDHRTQPGTVFEIKF